MSVTILFIALMVLGTLSLGYNDIQKKKYLNLGVDDQVMLCVSFVGSSILLVLPLLFLGFPQIKAGFWPAVIGTIALNLVSQNLFIRAFKYNDASLIAPLRLIIPPLVVVTGFVFLGEIPTWQGILGIVITMTGLWLLLFPNYRPSFVMGKGVAYGLLGSLLSAISFPLDKKAVISSSALLASSMIFFSLGVLTIVWNQIRNRAFLYNLFHVTRDNLRPLVNISLFFALGLFLTNQALNYSLVAYASSLKRLQALWTVVFAGKFLQEKQVAKRLIATLIMFAGIVLSVVFQ